MREGFAEFEIVDLCAVVEVEFEAALGQLLNVLQCIGDGVWKDI